jgi:hypothetical protein
LTLLSAQSSLEQRGLELEDAMAEQEESKQPEQAEANDLKDEELEQVSGAGEFDPQPEPPGRLRRELPDLNLPDSGIRKIRST